MLASITEVLPYFEENEAWIAGLVSSPFVLDVSTLFAYLNK